MNIPCKQGIYVMPAEVEAAYLRIHPSAQDEFARMSIWLELHPGKRPASPKSAPRFVANWFKRVPKIARAANERIAAVAALTGESNVIDMGSIAHRLGGTNLRAPDRSLWGAENVVDVEWHESGSGETGVGRRTRQIPA